MYLFKSTEAGLVKGRLQITRQDGKLLVLVANSDSSLAAPIAKTHVEVWSADEVVGTASHVWEAIRRSVVAR